MLHHAPLTMALDQGIEAIISCHPSLRLGAEWTMQGVLKVVLHRSDHFPPKSTNIYVIYVDIAPTYLYTSMRHIYIPYVGDIVYQ